MRKWAPTRLKVVRLALRRGHHLLPGRPDRVYTRVLAAPGIAFATAEAGFLALAKKRRVGHDRLAGMIDRHLRDVVVVIGNPDHQTRALA